MPIEIVTTVRDRSGDDATTSVQVQTGTTLAQLAAFAPLWATALNDIIYGKIMSVFAVVAASVVSIINNGGALTSDVEHIGKFSFRTLGGTNKVLVNIPALDENVASATDSDILNQADTEIAAFIAAMESGLTVNDGVGNVLIQPCDIGERQIAEIDFAREAFRNSGARR